MACPEEVQAEENPHELPMTLKIATRLKLSVPEIDDTMPVGEQRSARVPAFAECCCKSFELNLRKRCRYPYHSWIHRPRSALHLLSPASWHSRHTIRGEPARATLPSGSGILMDRSNLRNRANQLQIRRARIPISLLRCHRLHKGNTWKKVENRAGAVQAIGYAGEISLPIPLKIPRPLVMNTRFRSMNPSTNIRSFA